MHGEIWAAHLDRPCQPDQFGGSIQRAGQIVR
jgi:hypothetical protein